MLKMTKIQFLTCLWLSGFVHSELQFLERREGESVVLPCVVEQRDLSPFGVYLKRSWLQPSKVLFMYTNSEVSVNDGGYKTRVSVSGDPGHRALNVTLSELRVSDTDRYYCEFFVNRPSSEDERIHGHTEFFLLVTADAPGSEDIELLETCAGGSAVLPCLPPHGEGLAVEGVSLKRRRGRAPVEMLYHSRRHRGGGGGPASSVSSRFAAERVQLSLAPGPGGITYNLTLQRLQPDESGLYSCQLLAHGRADTSTSLGRRVFFVSVQGGHCGCSSYSTLLYALSSAVALLLLLLVVVGLVLIYQGKARRRSVKSRPQAPIYEEMAGVQPLGRKVAPRHLEETEASEYRNCLVKKSCNENQYESPSVAFSSRGPL
ncbi:cd7 antigen-like [Scophthalmus maximus]|uniref:cd7 antigen-like n=1 Tax=Scophthalmus maximus TaxID=52904 RepID=UPI001FA8BF4B|nr:cd7 antigen-like [Scophthalmus maximus]